MTASVQRESRRARAIVSALVFSLSCSLAPSLPSSAHTLKGGASTTKCTTCGKASGTYFQRHPKVKKATVGAGLGMGVGAVTGLVTRTGVVRGGAIGAGTGAGVGLLQGSETMQRHPIMKDLAQGTLVGAGLGLASHKGRGKGKKTTQSAVAGGAVGLGIGLLKNL